jgi:hypothetical protein
MRSADILVATLFEIKPAKPAGMPALLYRFAFDEQNKISGMRSEASELNPELE